MNTKSEILLTNDGYCQVCGAKTILACHRCGDFYCSRECQLKNWQSHRYICFPVPSLVHPRACSIFAGYQMLIDNVSQQPESNEIPPTLANKNLQAQQINEPDKKQHQQEVKTTDLKPNTNQAKLSANPKQQNQTNSIENKNIPSAVIKMDNAPTQTQTNSNPNKNISNIQNDNSLVSLVKFCSSNCCYICDVGDSHKNAVFEIQEKVNKVAPTLPRVDKKVPGNFALGHYDGQYRRIKIVNKDRYLFLDEGIVRNCSDIELRQINKELLNLPYCSRRIQLNNIPYVPMTQNCTEFLAQFEQKLFSVKKFKFFELYHKDTNISLNAEIVKYFKDTANNRNSNDVEHQRSNSDLAPKPNSNLNQPTTISNPSSPTEPIGKPPTEDSNVKKPDTDVKALSLNKSVNEILQKSFDIQQQLKEDCLNPGPVQAEVTVDAKESNVTQKNDTISQSPTPDKNEESEKKETTTTSASSEETKTSLSEDQKPITPNNLSASNGIPVLHPPFEIRRLECGNKDDNAFVFIVDNTNMSKGIISVFNSNNAGYLSDLQEKLDKFTDCLPYSPVLKEYVIASLDGAWARAQVLHIDPITKECTLLWIDYTHATKVHQVHIRRYPNWLTVPCHTNVCLIEDIPYKLNNAQLVFLETKLRKNNLLKVDSVKFKHNMVIIQCKSLINELKLI